MEWLGEEIIVLNRLELICGVGTATQRFTIFQLLNIAEASRDTAIAVGVVAVKGYGDCSIAAGVHFALIEDRLYTLIDNLRGLPTIGVKEVAVHIGFILGAVDVAVAQG